MSTPSEMFVQCQVTSDKCYRGGGVIFRNFVLFSMYSNHHNFLNNDRVEVILVPNDVELNNDRVELVLVPNDVELNNVRVELILVPNLRAFPAFKYIG